MAGYCEKIISKHGLTGAWLNVLRILRGQYPNPCKMSLISERIIDKKTDLSRMATRLESAGFIESRIPKDDKRIKHITITQKGLHTLAIIDSEKEQLLLPVNVLSTQEAQQLSVLLDKILSELNG